MQVGSVVFCSHNKDYDGQKRKKLENAPPKMKKLKLRETKAKSVPDKLFLSGK